MNLSESEGEIEWEYVCCEDYDNNSAAVGCEFTDDSGNQCIRWHHVEELSQSQQNLLKTDREAFEYLCPEHFESKYGSSQIEDDEDEKDDDDDDLVVLPKKNHNKNIKSSKTSSSSSLNKKRGHEKLEMDDSNSTQLKKSKLTTFIDPNYYKSFDEDVEEPEDWESFVSFSQRLADDEPPAPIKTRKEICGHSLNLNIKQWRKFPTPEAYRCDGNDLELGYFQKDYLDTLELCTYKLSKCTNGTKAAIKKFFSMIGMCL